MEQTNNPVVELLKAVVNLIDTVSPRGAFQGSELLQVGVIRTDLLKLIETQEQVAPVPEPDTKG